MVVLEALVVDFKMRNGEEVREKITLKSDKREDTRTHARTYTARGTPHDHIPSHNSTYAPAHVHKYTGDRLKTVTRNNGVQWQCKIYTRRKLNYTETKGSPGPSGRHRVAVGGVGRGSLSQ